MKAVIMAGGKGTRLRPLTCHLPKPMVPLLNRPCMEYIIELLKRHGITDIAITVQYLPQVIKNHFGDGSDYGVNLHYFEETVPLGTAGSVKNAEDFLDDTFLVISGDGITDFNLSHAIAFHREKRALGTLVLTRVDVPLEYGVVMTESNGKIVRFLEKPSWSEVFSDTVNTGIYVLEPEVLRYCPEGDEFDFSKDLFPLIMQRGMPLYGYVAGGYWSDIGNLDQYRQTQFDMLSGLVAVTMTGNEQYPSVWIGNDVCIHPDAQIEGPAFIGDGTVLHAGAKVGPYSILGLFNRIEHKALVEHSVLWSRNDIGRSGSVTGAILCSGISMGAGASVCDGAVIGEKGSIGDLAVIKPGVKIWPYKVIGPSVVQESSLIWGKSATHSLFGVEGISGIANIELTPELTTKIAAAYGSCLKLGSTVSVSCDENVYSRILKYSVISSLLAIGMKVRDVGTTVAPIARYECRGSSSDGAIHIRHVGTDDEMRIVLQFFDRDGLPIEKGMERKIENAFLQEDFIRPATLELRLTEQAPNLVDAYIWEILSRVDVSAIRARRLKVVFHCESPYVITIVQRILDHFGSSVIAVFNGETALDQIVMANKADLGIFLDMSAQSLRIFTDAGKQLLDNEVMVLQSLIAAKDGLPMAIPVTAPSIIEDMMGSAGVPIVRTKAAARSLLEVRKVPLQIHLDGLYSIACVMDFLARTGTGLQRVMDVLPNCYMSTDTVSCPIESKGRIMRRLMDEMKGQELELIDGIKVKCEDGWALILPDVDHAVFKLIAQGSTKDRATELTEMYKHKISFYQEG